MNFITRRYKDENDAISLLVLVFSGFGALASFYYAAHFYNIGTYWTILPLMSFFYSLIIFYGVSSYNKPKPHIKGHYSVIDFYKLINPVRKIPFIIDYVLGLLLLIPIPLLIMSFLTYKTILDEKSQLFYAENYLFLAFYLCMIIIYALIRFNYFSALEEKVIIDHEIIEFFENFEGGDKIKKEYTDALTVLEEVNASNLDLERCRNSFQKKSVLRDVLKIAKMQKTKKELMLLKEELSRASNE